MDIESDDSERWEDFFGSSTSLHLGICDILTNLRSVDSTDGGRVSKTNKCQNGKDLKSAVNNNINNDYNNYNSNSSSHSSLNEELPHSVACSPGAGTPIDVQIESDNCSSNSSLTLTSGSASIGRSGAPSPTVSNHSSCSSNGSTSSPHSNRSPGSAGGGSKSRNNIRVPVSRNVHRLITHSDVEPVDAVDIEPSQLQSPIQSPLLSQRFPHKSPATSANGHKLKLSHIPLSRNTGKLTQSGSDLVQTFDSSNEYLDAFDSGSYWEKKQSSSASSQSIKKPPTPGVVEIPSADDEKTPTNKVSPFNFESGAFSKSRKLTLPKFESQQSIKLIEMEQLATTAQLISNASKPEPVRISKEFVATEPLSAFEVVEAINYSLTSSNIDPVTTKTPSLTSVELIEALNKPLISKPVVRSSSAVCASTVSGSPLFTYARSKSLAAKANTIGGPVPIKIPTPEELEEMEEASKMSAESLDRLTDIKSKFSPKESRKLSGLVLPDIAKLKLRPLSSSSICSTSSSSSSGSDQLNSKLHTSYQASAESLADQSENEMMEMHTGLTVFQRSCMEIVDSERSYVEDLGQVIRGYLHDWKKRACLSYDELRILFSNIEEIYDFNSTLLKQLINSGMDPEKIAKCFIDLRERFDVYTTYCTSYPEAISLLTKLLQATHTNALLTCTQKMLQHTLPLGSYLLKPVQRILKYHLLLDNLLKHCNVKEVFQAYEIMRQVARNIDQVKRKLEQQSRVKELSGILDGWLGPELTVLGELRQEGLLMEHNKPRMVFLFSTMLIITKSKEDNRLQFKSYIHQNNLMLSEHLPGEPTSFYVIPYDEPRNQIKLTAKNRDQKRLWAQHIKGVILEKFENIPNRAKELVYKLGDEEDRTPDKNTRKWSLHSASPTPVYLERRNQYRRSEIRNRSKFKRKTVTNSSSFDSFNEMQELTKDSPKAQSPRNKTMDDSVLPSLQKLAAAVKSKNKLEVPAIDGVNSPTQTKDKRCSSGILRIPKSPTFGVKALKERSKSVPRISLPAEDLEDDSGSFKGSTTNLDARKSKSTKSIEIKQYNHKTMPKRIATLKKQKKETATKKETSKFYMELNEFEVVAQNVLKITESTENLTDCKDVEQAEECVEDNVNEKLPDSNLQKTERDHIQEELLSPAEKACKDAQIILDLLKNKKEFERNRKKMQKKRTYENGHSLPNSPEPQERNPMDDLPPRPPSRSPPPLDSEHETELLKPIAPEEPIYESLLRNVHVPYKFSPVLGRSKSAQYYKPREKKSISTPRPESDYVTLVYSPEGLLQQIGQDAIVDRDSTTELRLTEHEHVQRDSSGSNTSSSSSSNDTSKRDSQRTVISVECSLSGNISELSNSTSEAIYSRPLSKTLMKRLLSSSIGKVGSESISNSESSLLPRARKSIENISLAFSRSNKPPERRVSDVTEMCRQSILHRQGSEAVGERMAHVDYADPKTLFSVAPSSEASLQRDSVVSLTSSNDSVCDPKRGCASASTELSTNFEYEDDVEACLENDFRDSAIYSDDNDKRLDHDSADDVKRPRSPLPLPANARARNIPQVPPKPAAVPPVTVIKRQPQLLISEHSSQEIIIRQHELRQAASRSWVLQQIENFNK